MTASFFGDMITHKSGIVISVKLTTLNIVPLVVFHLGYIVRCAFRFTLNFAGCFLY